MVFVSGVMARGKKCLLVRANIEHLMAAHRIADGRRERMHTAAWSITLIADRLASVLGNLPFFCDCPLRWPDSPWEHR